ncbi:MAG: hypothetical protein M1541_18790 [Acidobacteria bacterium]|nr:hypothetical protein [Acidobacteriota bacterium]
MSLPRSNLLVYCARALVALWAAFWIWFGLASGLGEGLDFTGVLLHAAVPGLVFAFLALVAWHWETAGGSLLILIALLIAGAYPKMMAGNPRVIFPTIVVLALPPLVAGILFVAHSRGKQRYA